MSRFETKFFISEDGDLIYNLAFNGTYSKGKPDYCNDIMVKITPGHVRMRKPPCQEVVKEVAEVILNALNLAFPCENDPTEPTSEEVDVNDAKSQ